MLYNRNNLAVAKIASKSETRPEISGVFFTKDHTVATDSFRLIEMSVPKYSKVEDYPKVDKKSAMRGVKPFIVNAKYLKDKIKLPEKSNLPMANLMAISHVDENKVEVLSFDKEGMGSPTWLPRISGNYPDYQKIFPTGEAVAEVSVNAEFLAELCEIMGKLNHLQSVKIKLYGKNEPMVLEAKGGDSQQSARAMLMPLRDDK